MKVSDVIEVSKRQLEESLNKVSASIEGVTFSVTFKKTPSLETKTTYIFSKNEKVEE